MSNEISDSEKTILTGRIYPAIQSCVNNRYKIIVGYFAVVGFLLAVSDEKSEELIESGAASFLALIFSLFVVHNSVNYWRNSSDQSEHEHKPKKRPLVDIFSSLIMVGLIWCGHFLLIKYQTTA